MCRSPQYKSFNHSSSCSRYYIFIYQTSSPSSLDKSITESFACILHARVLPMLRPKQRPPNETLAPKWNSRDRQHLYTRRRRDIVCRKLFLKLPWMPPGVRGRRASRACRSDARRLSIAFLALRREAFGISGRVRRGIRE